MVVMILKVEPGGPVDEYAVPASARTSPVPGWRTAIPPLWPASAVDRRLFDLRADRRAHRRGRRAVASGRAPVPSTDSVPPGATRQLRLERPLQARGARPVRRRGSRARGARGAASGGIGPSSPTVSAAAAVNDVERSAALRPATWPSRGEDRAPARHARCGVAAPAPAPHRGRRAPGASRCARPAPRRRRAARRVPRTVPKARVRTVTGTDTAPSSGSRVADGPPSSPSRSPRFAA